MTGVERLREYVNLPIEDDKRHARKAPKNWPKKGSLEMIDVSLRYEKNLPESLSSINLKIEPGEKVNTKYSTFFSKILKKSCVI